MRRVAAGLASLAGVVLLLIAGAMVVQRQDQARARLSDRTASLVPQQAIELRAMLDSPGRNLTRAEASRRESLLTSGSTLDILERHDQPARSETLVIAPGGVPALIRSRHARPAIRSPAGEQVAALISRQPLDSGIVERGGQVWAYASVSDAASGGRWVVASTTGEAVPGLVQESWPTALILVSAAIALLLGAGVAFAGPRQQLRQSAITDQLTGLPNRRSMHHDLELIRAGHESVRLALFDLNEFKAYNDTFGHQAGDALLARMGKALGACIAPGHAYRLGGDEFCVISPIGYADAVESRAEYALTEAGSGFTITVSWGSVAVPAEASTPLEALALADERMYQVKEGRRSSALAQTKATLTELTAERDPELADHHQRVADLVEQVATCLGLHRDQIAATKDAAELHDIGLFAIPASVRAQASPLDPAERELQHRDAIIGARILGAADSLQNAAAIMRASQERWDGTGYPGHRKGRDIPIGARILCVCDAYDTMINTRPYRGTYAPGAARDEVRAQAGRQFDPEVVAAFESVLDAGYVTEARMATAGLEVVTATSEG
jgi:diguanylate cyclase (GGDEF)-like protein